MIEYLIIAYVFVMYGLGLVFLGFAHSMYNYDEENGKKPNFSKNTFVPIVVFAPILIPIIILVMIGMYLADRVNE